MPEGALLIPAGNGKTDGRPRRLIGQVPTGGSTMPSSAGLGARPGQLPSLPSAESVQAAPSKSPFQARASARGSPHQPSLVSHRCALTAPIVSHTSSAASNPRNNDSSSTTPPANGS